MADNSKWTIYQPLPNGSGRTLRTDDDTEAMLFWAKIQAETPPKAVPDPTVTHKTFPRAEGKPNLEFKEDICSHGDCAKTRFYKHTNAKGTWYSHKGDDGSYHNLK